MNEIIPDLFVGDMSEGSSKVNQMSMSVLSVMWGEEDGTPPGVKNIMTTLLPMGDDFCGHAMASPENMNEAADWIHDELSAGNKVLVHCAFGMERSPLTVVWYLMRYHAYSLAEAYRVLKIKRGMVSDRSHWLPKGWESFVKLQKEAA